MKENCLMNGDEKRGKAEGSSKSDFDAVVLLYRQARISSKGQSIDGKGLRLTEKP
jgi:hypothetical protein